MIDLSDEFMDYEQCSFNSLTAEQQQALIAHEKIYYQGVYGGWTPISEIYEPGSRTLGDGALYIGGIEAVTKETCQAYEINTVLNMADDCMDDEIPGVNMYRIGIADGELPPKGVWEKAAQIINHTIEPGGAVLVHCRAGISRSVTAAIAFLMIHYKMGWASAYHLIRSKRPCVYPHPILMRGLIRDLGDRFVF